MATVNVSFIWKEENDQNLQKLQNKKEKKMN